VAFYLVTVLSIYVLLGLGNINISINKRIRKYMSLSKFSEEKGILFAADVGNYKQLFSTLDLVYNNISGIKVGTSLVYRYGAEIIKKMKDKWDIPVIADVKITDVPHIALVSSQILQEHGADAVVISGICGPEVFKLVSNKLDKQCEVWAFSEFTNDTGLIDVSLADESIRLALDNGAKGIQAPGTRPYRIEEIRDDFGSGVAIMACGIGVQGGKYGSAIKAGANFEIVGRSIYAAKDPFESSYNIKNQINNIKMEALVDA